MLYQFIPQLPCCPEFTDLFYEIIMAGKEKDILGAKSSISCTSL